MGMEKAIEYYKNNDEFDMVLITKDGLITISEGIEEAFSLLDSYEDREINVVRK